MNANMGAAVGALSYLGLGVSSPAEWTGFAAQLGLMPAADGPDGSIRYRTDEQAWRLAVHESSADDLLYAGFDCGTQDSFDALTIVNRSARDLHIGDITAANPAAVASVAIEAASVPLSFAIATPSGISISRMSPVKVS